jgi:predicted Rossmann-fold nucleotide-binding protein
LYSPDSLFSEFDPTDAASSARTFDARTYLATRVDRSENTGMQRAVHDQHITVARDRFVNGRSVVAIMGGHAERRGSDVYRQVAGIAHRLADRFLVASGGGPGAMEATHVGAMCTDQQILNAVIDTLTSAPEFPHGLKDLVVNGSFSDTLVAKLHAWQKPAFAALDQIDIRNRRESLAIPTWFYGHEPPTPFATHIAKYFYNALREDGLLAVADAGVVYAPGKAGTLQEVFQDAAQNYYESFGRFSPMAFLDIDGYWSRTFPVEQLLRPLFGREKYERWILISADADEIVSFMEESGRA